MKHIEFELNGENKVLSPEEIPPLEYDYELELSLKEEIATSEREFRFFY